MLACARIGAPHSVVFGGFSAEALALPHRRRQHQGWSSPRTAATGAARRARSSRPSTRPWRCPRARPSRRCSSCAAPSRTSPGPTTATSGGTTRSAPRAPSTTPQAFDSEHPLFILYTSGTTGKPKGILHTSGGYLTQTVVHASRTSSTTRPETDVYWCTADIGWVTGHSYIVYGPLSNGATQVMYEGTPGHPAQGPLVGAHREVRRVDPLHRADRDPHVHEVGRADPGRARPVVAAAARLGRRADQPGGLDLVPPGHRRRPHARSSTPGGRPRPARS